MLLKYYSVFTQTMFYVLLPELNTINTSAWVITMGCLIARECKAILNAMRSVISGMYYVCTRDLD